MQRLNSSAGGQPRYLPHPQLITSSIGRDDLELGNDSLLEVFEIIGDDFLEEDYETITARIDAALELIVNDPRLGQGVVALTDPNQTDYDRRFGVVRVEKHWVFHAIVQSVQALRGVIDHLECEIGFESSGAVFTSMEARLMMEAYRTRFSQLKQELAEASQ